MLLDVHLNEKSNRKQLIKSVHNMPEPIKKYVNKERSADERANVVNHLQNLMRYSQISEDDADTVKDQSVGEKSSAQPRV